MKKLLFSLSLLLFVSLVFTSCKKDEPIAITIDATDYVVSVSYTTYGTWVNGSLIGTITASTNSGNLNYTLVSQNIAEAIAVNASTGQITVANRNAFNTACVVGGNGDVQSTAVVKITNGSVTRDINITITLVGWCI
jgi:hypothetical protein